MVGRDMGGAQLERLVAEETEASERARDEPLSGRAARKRQTRSVVYSIRLTPGQTGEIQRIAEAAGIPAAGLVRGWVLQGRAAERRGRWSRRWRRCRGTWPGCTASSPSARRHDRPPVQTLRARALCR